MSDNTRLPQGTQDGDIYASDDIAGVKFQRVKLTLGADGATDGDVSSTNALPISDNGGSITIDATSLPLPTLAATSTKQSDGSQKTQVVDGSGNVIGATSNALDVNIKSGASAGTEYTEDAAAAANPVGGMLITRRRDTLTAAEVTTDGDNIAVNATAKGEVYVKQTDAVPITDNSGSLTVDQPTGTNLHTVIDSGTVTTVSTVSTITNVVHVDDNSSTLSIDDGAGSITVDSLTDGTVAPGTAATKSELVGLVYNTTPPAPTNGQQVAAQADAAGNLKVFPSNITSTGTVINSSTGTLNATFNLVANSGAHWVLVQLDQTTTITAGAITFEQTFDDTNWSTATMVLDPANWGNISLPYTLQANTNKSFLINMMGARQVRLKVSTAMTGTGAITPYITQIFYDVTSTGMVTGSGVVTSNTTRVTLATDVAVPITDNSGSITVDNGGTFAVQATIASGATAIAKAEDVASADADVGIPAMAIRKATPANTSGTDGDYEMLQMSAGRLWTNANTDQLGGTAIAMNTGTRSAGTQRVTIATDDVVPASQSGTWTVQPGNTANTTAWKVDGSAVTQPTKEQRAATPSQSSVANSASSVSLLASNANRLGATIFNDDTAVTGASLKVKLGTTASATSFTVVIAPQGYYEVPFNYTGAIDGIASAATGNARITELTA